MLTQSELSWLTEELSAQLVGGSVQKIYAEGPDAYVLRLRIPGASYLLRVVLDPALGRAHFTRAREPQPPSPTSFTMLLRKRLGGMVVRHVIASPNDRVLTLRGDVRDPVDDGARAQVALVIELTGAVTNAFVLGADDVILGVHSASRAAERDLSTGDTYTPPTPPPASEDAIQHQNRFLDDPTVPPDDDPLHATPRALKQQSFASRRYVT